MNREPACWLALTVLLLLAAAAHAQGAPPFRTDDPETPGNRHWEINFGWIGDRNPAAQTPDFDFNYGLGERIQLKYEIPIAIERSAQLDRRCGPAGAAGPQGAGDASNRVEGAKREQTLE